MTLKSNVIDISEPGLFETMNSYYKSVQYWNENKDPMYKLAADKERARYQYLKDHVLGNSAA